VPPAVGIVDNFRGGAGEGGNGTKEIVGGGVGARALLAEPDTTSADHERRGTRRRLAHTNQAHMRVLVASERK
jgi:hypothetical protein